MSPEKLTGPKKSKLAIDDFEDWLIEKCSKEKLEKDKILAEYQYLSGHALRKLNEWLDAIQTKGRIKVVRSSGEDYIARADSTAEEEKGIPQSPPFKAEEISKKRIIKKIMQAGYCEGRECPPGSEDECTYCLQYAHYKRRFKQPKEDLEE